MASDFPVFAIFTRRQNQQNHSFLLKNIGIEKNDIKTVEVMSRSRKTTGNVKTIIITAIIFCLIIFCPPIVRQIVKCRIKSISIFNGRIIFVFFGYNSDSVSQFLAVSVQKLNF